MAQLGVGLLRKNRAPKHISHEQWQAITFLVALFTMMYAMSTVDSRKAGRMVTSMKASFSSPMSAPGNPDLSLSQSNGSGAPLGKDLIENVKSADEQASANSRNLRK